MDEMGTDDGFFNATMGAYWLTGGNNRISAGEISRETLDCKDGFLIEIIWDTLAMPVRLEKKKWFVKLLSCLLVIFHNHYGQNCRFCILDSSCCVFMYRKGLNWRVLRLFTRLLMRTKTETVSRNKRLRSCKTTFFLSLSAFLQKQRQQNWDVSRLGAKLHNRYKDLNRLLNSKKCRYCTLTLGKHQMKGGNTVSTKNCLQNCFFAIFTLKSIQYIYLHLKGA